MLTRAQQLKLLEGVLIKMPEYSKEIELLQILKDKISSICLSPLTPAQLVIWERYKETESNLILKRNYMYLSEFASFDDFPWNPYGSIFYKYTASYIDLDVDVPEHKFNKSEVEAIQLHVKPLIECRLLILKKMSALNNVIADERLTLTMLKANYIELYKILKDIE